MRKKFTIAVLCCGLTLAVVVSNVSAASNTSAKSKTKDNNVVVVTQEKENPSMIMGKAIASKEQVIKYLQERNPNPKINCSIEELVEIYYQEATLEGVRPDVAFAQALLETGHFDFFGTVVPEQNNYAGIGTTSATVRGNYFPTPAIGVRAQIQHLLAYASLEKPKQALVDPRYHLVNGNPKVAGQAKTWHDLDGRWAASRPYGAKILKIHSDIMAVKVTAITKKVNKLSVKDFAKLSLEERTKLILAGEY